MAVSARRSSKVLAVCTNAASPAAPEKLVRALSTFPSRIVLGARHAACDQTRFRASSAVLGSQSRMAGTVSTPSSFQSPIIAYKSLVADGKISHDHRQEMVMQKLSQLADKVQNYSPPAGVVHVTKRVAPKTPPKTESGGLFGGLFGGSSQPAKPAAKPQAQVERLNIPPGAERGLYVWGGCGTGKTFMMDLFHHNIPIKKKRRVHFHEWMIEVHEKLHRLQKKNQIVSQKANTTWTAEAAMAQRKALKDQGFDGTHGKTAGGGEGADDLVAQVAQEMMDEAWLLCFDEFQVTHISDAIIMKRLFSILFEKGAVIIATSNRPPADLYLNGLNRSLFMPFIPMLQERCDVHDIDSAVDYRLLSLAEEDDRRVYLTPTKAEETSEELLKILERKFYRLCRNQVQAGVFVETQGRRIAVNKSGAASNVAWFNFRDLCDKPLGAADYFAICTMFHTVFVADIPKLTLMERDQVRRMITMIDSFYERHVKLVCTAAKDPLNLFEISEEESKNTAFDEVFAWDRTASRLIEMQSVEYLSEWIRDIEGDQFLAQLELTSLSDDDVADLWTRYDRDNNGTIDRDECRVMLEDVMEATQHHRHVSDELSNMFFDSVDTDGSGEIDQEEFAKHLKSYGLTTILRKPDAAS